MRQTWFAESQSNLTEFISQNMKTKIISVSVLI